MFHMQLFGPVCLLPLVLGCAPVQGDEAASTKTVSAGDLELQVPSNWTTDSTSSDFRVAQFTIPGEKPDGGQGELVVYHFDGPTGGAKANIERWIAQFLEEDRKVLLRRGDSEQGRYILVDISGTWKKPVGPPIAGRSVDQPGSRVMNVMLTIDDKEGEKDYYFLKLSGPAELVGRHAKALRSSFGAELDSEEPYETDQKKVMRTEQEWKQLLTPEQYRVLRQKGTERPFVNKYDKHFKPGTYACAACGQELFSSGTKFNSGCGWPAFYAAKAGDRVTLSRDLSLGMVRTEVCCARCGSHLGHIFDDAPQTPTGQRYCINSVSLKFIPAEEAEEDNSDSQ